MKIGIMTFWESKNNYGQILQLFALQSKLNKLGHDSFLIKYRRIPPKTKNLWIKNPVYILKVIVKKFLINSKPTTLNDELRKFNEFKQKNIVFGENEYLCLDDLKSNPPAADIYIVGSDQVWNNNFSVSAEAFLLGFGDQNIRRVAYAASFGQKELTANTKELFKKYIDNFNSVSVREESGVSICKDLNVPNPQWVLDPTLLFTKEEWKKILGLKDTPVREKSIFVYTLGNSETNDKTKFIEYANNLNEYKIIHASANNDASGNAMPTIPEWVNYIKDAELVITTSFHGMVFCLLNNTNFIVLPNTGHAEGMNERILSLLTLVGLNDHLMTDFSESIMANILAKKIDWNHVNRIIETQRNISLDYLKNSLS